MKIGHSRLLKFLTQDKTKMEKHTLKIENLAPSDIDSEVPRHQNLREAPTEPPRHEPVQNVSDGKLTLKQGDTVETYAPVITVKTVESNFGKEGMRFQRKTVTEDVSEGIAWTDLRDMIKKPVYMGLQEEVIRTQSIRPPRNSEEGSEDERGIRDSKEPKNGSGETLAADKPQTKIPVFRFKPLAERVMRERRQPEAQKSKREAPEKPRRTSIPKPKDKISILKKNTTTDESQTVKIDSEHLKEARDEIPVKTNERRPIKRDRIPVLRKDHYKVIKKDKKSESEDENHSLNYTPNESVKTDSSEKLDDEFDKLYDEIVDTDVASLPDEILEAKVKDPEKLDSTFEEIVHQYDDKTIEKVTIEPVDKARYSRIPLLRRRSSHDVKPPGQLERRLSLKTVNMNKSVEVNNKEIIKLIKETHDINEDSVQLVPEDKENENPQEDSILEINNNEEIEDRYFAAESPHPIPDYNTIPTPDSELVKVGIFGISTRDIPLEEASQNTLVATPELETVKVALIDMPAEDALIHINEDSEIGEPKTQVPEDDFKVEDENKAIADNANSYENNDTEIISTMEEDSVNDVNNGKESLKDECNVYDQTQKNNLQPDILVRNPDDDLKSFGLLRNTNSIEERTKSRYINKPQHVKVDNKNEATKEEIIPIINGKVSSIKKRLTSQEYASDLSTSNSTGKKVTEVYNDVDSIPKKKSVLSKIAMFERAEPEPPFARKTVHRYSKPKRTISKDLKHSPKIIQEVLKPKGAEQADNHTIVTIDIIKSVDVVTHNEEQVIPVHHLKEETVTYDNFDDARLYREDSVEIESKNVSIGDQNETVSTKLINVDDKQEIRDVKQETKRHITTKDDKPKFNDYYYERTNGAEVTKNQLKNREVDKWKSTDALANFVPVKDKINRIKSYDGTNEDKNIKKDTAALDLGDAVKGKVKNIIVRINSFELLDDVKPKEVEVISVKERPRKRSVSEKIALFERKLTPVAMEPVNIVVARGFDIDSKTDRDSDNSIQMTEYAAKIQELVNAKLKYGSADMSYVELSDGTRMPVLALGTALLDPRLAKHVVAAAIDLGFRAIDTAFIYGNEREVGEGIRAKIQDGTVRREDLFILSKLWSTFHRPDLVETACRASLAATGLEYFDLFMIHNPMSLKEGGDPVPKIANVLQFSEYDYLDAWFAMERLVPKGLVRSVGVSNFNSAQVARVLEKGRIKPVINQVECHPYLNQQRLSDFCESRHVHLSCFGVLGSKGTPAELKASRDAAIDDPLVQVMAAGLDISPAQLLIKYQIESGHSVVVKASSGAHLWDNLRALNVMLEPAQIAALQALNKNKRIFTFKGMGDTHRNYPFKIPF